MQVFDAPLLRDVASNIGGNAIAKLEGTRKVQYGVLVDEWQIGEKVEVGQDVKLVLADRECIQIPSGQRRTISEQFELLKSQISQRRAMVRLRRSQ